MYPEIGTPVGSSSSVVTVRAMVDSTVRSSRHSRFSRRRAWGRRAGANRDSDRVVAVHQRTLGSKRDIEAPLGIELAGKKKARSRGKPPDWAFVTLVHCPP